MKHHNLILLVASVFFAAQANTQPAIGVQRAAGGSGVEYFTCMTRTSDGGTLAGGYSYSNISGEKTADAWGRNASCDYWIIKYDAAGTIEWDKTIGGYSDDKLSAIVQTTDGGYILGGSSISGMGGNKTENGLGGQDFWVVKVDAMGNIEWDKTIGGAGTDGCSAIKQASDGGYFVAGNSDSNISGHKTENNKGDLDYWLVKLNRAGSIEWDKTIGGSARELLHDLVQTADGGCVLAGNSQSGISGNKTEISRGGHDYWIVKVDNTGNVVWDKTMGGYSDDILNCIQQTTDGGYILGGYSLSGISGEKTQERRGLAEDYWVIKLDALHNIEWDRTAGGNRADYLQHIEQTSTGLYVACGYSWSNKSGEKSENTKDGNAAYSDYWVVLLDVAGRVRADKTIGSATDDFCFSIKELPKNNFVVGGYTAAGISGDKNIESRGSTDYWLVTLKYNKAGSLDAVASAAYSKAVIAAASSFSLYPNPTTNVLHIKTNGKASFALSDQSGKTILTKNITNSGYMDVSKLLPGTYFLVNKKTGASQTVIVSK